MSVINTVLRRLDARGIKPALPGSLPNAALTGAPPQAPGYLHIEHGHGAPIEVQAKTPSQRGRSVAVGGALALGAVAAAWLYSGDAHFGSFGPSSKLPKPPAIVAAAPVASPTPTLRAVPVVAPTPTPHRLRLRLRHRLRLQFQLQRQPRPRPRPRPMPMPQPWRLQPR